MTRSISSIYKKLYLHFGPQRWWPAATPFEVIVGAILTQNTSWLNVEKAIINLKKHKALEPFRLYKLPHRKLASLVKSTGYYNIKAKRLKEFLSFFIKSYQGKIRRMSLENAKDLHRELLSVKGIGPETADSILLYALGKPVFVIDAYTKRILLRHGFIRDDASYNDMQNLFMKSLKPDAGLFNEYHALLVRLGKDFCLKSKPRCQICPLKGLR